MAGQGLILDVVVDHREEDEVGQAITQRKLLGGTFQQDDVRARRRFARDAEHVAGGVDAIGGGGEMIGEGGGKAAGSTPHIDDGMH